MAIRNGVSEREQRVVEVGPVAADEEDGGLPGHLDCVAGMDDAGLEGGGCAVDHAGNDGRSCGKTGGCRSGGRDFAHDVCVQADDGRQHRRVDTHPFEEVV